MHGYMMPSIAPKNNPQTIFTWLHYAATTGATMPAKSGNSRLRAISSQKLGGELPPSRHGRGRRDVHDVRWLNDGVLPPNYQFGLGNSLKTSLSAKPQRVRIILKYSLSISMLM